MKKAFTGWQWLLIDVANQMGKDKLTFEERISWTEANLDKLEAVRKQRAMIDGNHDLSRLLSEKSGLEVGFQILPRQSHRSVWPLALHYGLMHVLRNG